MDVQTSQSSLLTEAFGTIAFRTGDGIVTHAVPRHFGRHEVSFELLNLDATLRASEVLTDFSVTVGGRLAYQGRATTTGMTSSGNRTVCSAALEGSWLEPGIGLMSGRNLHGAFDVFLDLWQKQCRVQPQFKVVVADLQSFLVDLELWLAQIEAGTDSRQEAEVDQSRVGWAQDLAGCTMPILNALFEKFERTAAEADPEGRPAHRVFARRQLHPWLLCAPFLHRTYRKPLGYAGDFEMVNMITRDPHEGASLYSKLVNLWFLQQPPAEAHRNRLKLLERRLVETAISASQSGRPARVLSLGCGPAIEVQEFLAKNKYPGQLEFTLIDFNQETLDRTKRCLNQIQQGQRRGTRVDYVRKSVMAILKEGGSATGIPDRASYDFVYCAGLYDYLTDPVCRRVSTQLYERVRPGGLFLSTNVHDSNPWPFVMDFVMDWHLIYRSTPAMLATRPDQVDPEDCVLTTDSTGVNIYLEARKSRHG